MIECNNDNVFDDNKLNWSLEHECTENRILNQVTNPWSALELGIFGDIENGFGIGDCSNEDDDTKEIRTTDDVLQSALSSLAIVKKGRLGLGSSMAEEFDDPREQIAYLLIQEKVRNCFIEGLKINERKGGISWVFTPLPDQFDRTFRECCEVLRVRPWVLQTRIHFQYYKKGMLFEEPMPLETVRLPTIIQGEAGYYGGDEGVIIANMLWLQPGMLHQYVATSKHALRSLYALEEKGIVSENGGQWYMTGRNPMLKHYIRASVSWSTLWPYKDFD